MYRIIREEIMSWYDKSFLEDDWPNVMDFDDNLLYLSGLIEEHQLMTSSNKNVEDASQECLISSFSNQLPATHAEAIKSTQVPLSPKRVKNQNKATNDLSNSSDENIQLSKKEIRSADNNQSAQNSRESRRKQLEDLQTESSNILEQINLLSKQAIAQKNIETTAQNLFTNLNFYQSFPNLTQTVTPQTKPPENIFANEEYRPTSLLGGENPNTKFRTMREEHPSYLQDLRPKKKQELELPTILELNEPMQLIDPQTYVQSGLEKISQIYFSNLTPPPLTVLAQNSPSNFVDVNRKKDSTKSPKQEKNTNYLKGYRLKKKQELEQCKAENFELRAANGKLNESIKIVYEQMLTQKKRIDNLNSENKKLESCNIVLQELQKKQKDNLSILQAENSQLKTELVSQQTFIKENTELKNARVLDASTIAQLNEKCKKLELLNGLLKELQKKHADNLSKYQQEDMRINTLLQHGEIQLLK